VLESFFIDADNGDAIVGRSRAAQGEAHIERALFDVAEELKTSTVVATYAGVGEKEKADGSNKQGDTEVGMARKEATHDERNA
jgi:hypothetical protein